MEPDEIIPRLKALRVPKKRIAQALGLAAPAGSRLLGAAEGRQLKAHEIPKLVALIREYEAGEQAPESDLGRYVRVEVLPTFGGAGGGGTGEGEVETALVSRALVRDELRGKPSDFVLIDVRGDSMEPDFRHGDQILVDKRDRSTAQPGPFALWDGDWGEYVLKNVERAEDGLHRVFSSNPKYSPKTVSSEETRIIGRPVWFGRRL